MLVPTTTLLLLAASQLVAGHDKHNRHAHAHDRRGAAVYTEVEVVTEVTYVTVVAPPGDAAASTPTAAVEAAPQQEVAVVADTPAAQAPAAKPSTTLVKKPKHRTAAATSAPVAASSPQQLSGSSEDTAPAVESKQNLATSSGNGQYPFSRVVAFGDSMTDNGNGSYAHCTQAGPGDCDNKIYGFGTWTNGPVAVSYLVDKLNVPLAADYAWGWNHGAGTGDKMAATIKQSYTSSPDSPDGFTQVANYLASDYQSTIADTLAFLWIGNMDISFPNFLYPDNSGFSTAMASMTSQLVDQLISAGAPYVFVPGLYAKNIAPFHTFMASQPDQQAQMGQAIQQANAAIKSELESKFGDKVIYYDVFSRMTYLWENAASYGIDMVGDNFCDGDTQHPDNFQECLMEGQGDRWFWINWTDPTTIVHSLIADDMYSTIQSRFG